MAHHPLQAVPTENQTFRLVAHGQMGDMAEVLRAARDAESKGRYEEACEIRYQAFQRIYDALPDEAGVELEHSHPNTAAAIEVIYCSAIDNFLVGEVEIAAAQAELLLECDSEDSLGITPILGLCYVAIGEWDCLEDTLADIDSRQSHHALLSLWLDFGRRKALSKEGVAQLLRHRALCDELRRNDHTTDEKYLQDITSDHPSQEASARELWLQNEPLFGLYPDFLPLLLEALGGAK